MLKQREVTLLVSQVPFRRLLVKGGEMPEGLWVKIRWQTSFPCGGTMVQWWYQMVMVLW